MKALTILNPWAHAIVFGPKRIENRRWATDHRGPLLIHVGRSMRWLEIARPGRLLVAGYRVPPVEEMAFGAVIGVAELVDCIPIGEVRGRPWAEGPVCWLLHNVRPLPEPLPLRGNQKLFEVPDRLVTHLLPPSMPTRG